MPVVLICMLLLLLSRRGEQLSVLRAFLASGCAAAATALRGAPGLFFLPVVAAWLRSAPAFAGGATSRTACLAILVAAACAMLPLAAYFNVLPLLTTMPRAAASLRVQLCKARCNS